MIFTSLEYFCHTKLNSNKTVYLVYQRPTFIFFTLQVHHNLLRDFLTVRFCTSRSLLYQVKDFIIPNSHSPNPVVTFPSTFQQRQPFLAPSSSWKKPKLLTKCQFLHQHQDLCGVLFHSSPNTVCRLCKSQKLFFFPVTCYHKGSNLIVQGCFNTPLHRLTEQSQIRPL